MLNSVRGVSKTFEWIKDATIFTMILGNPYQNFFSQFSMSRGKQRGKCGGLFFLIFLTDYKPMRRSRGYQGNQTPIGKYKTCKINIVSSPKILSVQIDMGRADMSWEKLFYFRTKLFLDCNFKIFVIAVLCNEPNRYPRRDVAKAQMVIRCASLARFYQIDLLTPLTTFAKFFKTFVNP